MRIERFGLTNYRPFCQSAAEDLDPAAEELPLAWLNFRNDIIILIGENNVGKTSLLSAYRDFRNSGFAPSEEDFFGCQVDRPIIMEIAFSAEEGDDLADDQTARWFAETGRIARVRKVWREKGGKVTKYSFDPVENKWVEGGFGGFDQILQSRLPDPVHIRPTMTPEEIRAEFQKLFKEIVQRYVANSEHVKTIESALKALVEEIEGDEYIKDVASRVAEVAKDIFPNLEIEIRNPHSEKGVGPLLEKQTDITLSVSDSPTLNMERHGQGSQRVFMLSALSVLAAELAAVSKKIKAKGGAGDVGGGKIIQIEEPELYLSPTAVRRMRKLLYALASQPGVQVMACTHSPILVDFSRPQQTIALVERTKSGAIIRQSDLDTLAKDPRDALKLLYQLNPVLSEALFANKVVLVEGDTEFAALSELLSRHHIDVDELDVHVVECGGKGSIPSFQRVLREFGKRYLVIHDLDVRYADRDTNIKQWEENEAIWAEIARAQAEGIDALGYPFVLAFEQAHAYEKTKPVILNAIKFVMKGIEDGSIKGSALFETFTCISEWKSPYKTLENLKTI